MDVPIAENNRCVMEICAAEADAIMHAYLTEAMDSTDAVMRDRFVSFANVARTIAENIRGRMPRVPA